MKKWNYKRWIYPFGIIITLILFFTISFKTKKNKEERLKKMYLMCHAKIIDFSFVGKGGANSAIFIYFINKKMIKNEYYPSTVEIRKYFSKISSYEWLMIYDSTDYKNATLLLQKSDYEKYGIPYKGQRVVDFEKMVIMDSTGIIEELGNATEVW